METKTLSLSTGAVTVPVERDGERVGELHFSPDDPAFLNRFYGLLTSMENRRKAVADLPQDEEHLAESLTALERSYAETVREIDIVFGEGTGALVFGDSCSPALLEQFFEGVAEILRPARAEKLESYLAPESVLH